MLSLGSRGHPAPWWQRPLLLLPGGMAVGTAPGEGRQDWTRDESSAQVGQLNALGNTGLSILFLHFRPYAQCGSWVIYFLKYIFFLSRRSYIFLM